MKHSRLAAAGTAAVAVAGLTLATGGVAQADIFYDPAAVFVNAPEDLGQVGDATPPASGWYVAAGAGTTSFGPGGLTLTGPVQVARDSAAAGAQLTTLVAGAGFESTGDVTVDVPLFLNATGTDTEPVVLSPATAGDADLSPTGDWVSDAPVGDLPAGTPAPLSAYQAEIDELDAVEDGTPDSEILGYGFSTTTTGAVLGIQVGDETTYFTPDPEGTYVPTTATLTELRTTGIEVDASGYFPGETVTVVVSVEGGQSASELDGVAFTADADGTISGTFVVPADAVTEPGTYAFTLAGATSGIALTSVVTVTADAVAAPAPTVPVGTAPVAVPVRAAASFTG